MTDTGEPRETGDEDKEWPADPGPDQAVPDGPGEEPEPDHAVYRPDPFAGDVEPVAWPDDAVPNPYDQTRTAPPLQEPGWFARTRASVPYYAVTMGLFAAVFWLPYASAHGRHKGLFVLLAALPTLFALTVVFLRIRRGSVADGIARTRENLSDYMRYGYHTVSPRIQNKLTEGEVVQWETALHPVSIIRRIFGWLNKNIVTRGLSVLYLVYVIGLIMTDRGSVATVLVGIAIPLALIAFAVSEWRHDRYAVTNQRIFAVVGMVTISDEPIPRATISSFKVVTPWQALFLAWLRLIDVPYGTWIIETPAAIEALENPSHIPAAAIVVTVFGLATKP